MTEPVSGQFTAYAIRPAGNRWEKSIERYHSLESRKEEIRSDFLRDYNRIIHSKAYRRLKHKTQVFFATTNDHICTRMEHVTHVASVSENIASFLGLNTELVRAIASGHDLGHAPFGHKGESILAGLAAKHLDEKFWHEKNSLFFIDHLELLPDSTGAKQNLNLTYAVRDGIICHCGEVDENGLFPRDQAIDLYQIADPSQVSPYTWEGCVVKISDKIAYLGRDIEDAITLKILDKNQLKLLKTIVENVTGLNVTAINNTSLMHGLIIDLCRNSSPEKGIAFSPGYFRYMQEIKDFNYQYIYFHPRLKYFHRFAEVIIHSVFDLLISAYKGYSTIENLKNMRYAYPELIDSFTDWVHTYFETDSSQTRMYDQPGTKVYNLDSQKDYIRSVIHYLSSTTDQYILRLFAEITRF